jgi:hypothetical protein
MIEELVTFTSTHLAMVTFLMPWKKLTTGEGDDLEVHLWTLFDMFNKKEWVYMDNGVAKVDESLPGIVTALLSLAVVSLFLSIVAFVLRSFYQTVDSNVHSIVDFLSWGSVLGLLIVSVLYQSDFDRSFDKHYRTAPADVIDSEKMFLSLGVIAVHISVHTFGVGKDVWDRLKQ